MGPGLADADHERTAGLDLEGVAVHPGAGDLAGYGLAVADRVADTIGMRRVNAPCGQDEKGQKQEAGHAPASAGRRFKRMHEIPSRTSCSVNICASMRTDLTPNG